MAVLPEFTPAGKPGEIADSFIQGRNAQESWMSMAQERQYRDEQIQAARQQREVQAAMFQIALPIKQAEQQAQIVKAKTEYQGALQTQALREGAYKMLDQARQDFDYLNLIPDNKLRAQASREWLSRYSQLQNVAELKEEMSVKNHLATSNVIDSIKIATLGTAESRAFEQLTQGLSPDEKERARHIKLGLEGRTSGAAIQYREVVGPDGSKILVAVDPRAVGTQIIGTGQTYGSGVGKTQESEAFADGYIPAGKNPFQGPTTAEDTTAKTTAAKEAEYQAKLKQEKPKRQRAIQQAETLSNRLSSDIDDLIDKVKSTTAGPGGVLLSKFPGTSARDLQASLDSIKANIGFQTLQAMRESSPTGGALGQVSDVENRLLQSVLGSLEIGQSPSQLIENLRKVKQRTIENFGINRAAFRSEFGEEHGSEPSDDKSTLWDDAKEARLRELQAKRSGK